MSQNDRSLSVVIPVYQSEPIVDQLVSRLTTVLPGVAGQYEIILVDDGSPDGSWKEIVAAGKKYPLIVGIRLSRNFGQHNALLAGIRRARFATVVTIDDDLQNPPEEIGKVLAKLEEGYDVVYGTPEEHQYNLWRGMATWVTKFTMAQVVGKKPGIYDVSAFRAFKTDLREAFANYSGPFVSIDVLLTWGTKNFGAQPVRQDKRAAGRSNYTFLKLVSHSMNLMTGFGVRPLQFASLVGFAFTLFGIGTFAYVLIRYLLQGSAVQGFAFLASIIAIFAGAQLFAIGIMGEYLGRIHFRLMGQPPYVVGDLASSFDQVR